MSVLFCDLTGSTELAERLDAESLTVVLERYYASMRREIERHGGVVEKFIGDAVVAVFGLPATHEDDALRAIRAAAGMRAAIGALNDELAAELDVRLETRIGINTGEVVISDATRTSGFVVGTAVNVAARLEQVASPGDVLLGPDTYRLVRTDVHVEELKPLDLKGVSGPVRAFRLVDMLGPGSSEPDHFGSPLIGRKEEVERLLDMFAAAVSERACHLAIVIGEAGVGKSRLAREFADRLGREVTVAHGRCLPYGRGITFWPVAEVVRQLAVIDDADGIDVTRAKVYDALGERSERAAVADRIVAALGLSDAATYPEEIFWAVRSFLESMAARRPLLTIFDDLQWADPAFLGLVEYLDRESRGCPLAVVVLARPGVQESWPPLKAGAADGSLIRLQPLDGRDAHALVGDILGQGEIDAELTAAVTSTAAGNPLFLNELLHVLVEGGAVVREDGHWRLRDRSAIRMSPTIEAVIGARLDRLGGRAQEVAECASVIGEEFWDAPLVQLVPDGADSDLGTDLATLTRNELIQRGSTALAVEDGYRFRHILIRDVAYGRLLKGSRANLHAALATWLEAYAGDRLPEYEEIVGYHLEQAHRYERDLGRSDADERHLATRAAEHLAAAGRRALARGDMAATASMLERAAGLLAPDAPVRLALLPEWAFALSELGSLAEAEALLDEAVAGARRIDDERIEWRAALEQAWVGYLRHGGAKEPLDAVMAAVRALTDAEDQEGLARGWQLVGVFEHQCVNGAAAQRALERALTYARDSGDRRAQTETLVWLLILFVQGPMPADEGIRRCDDILASTDSQKVRAFALIERGVLNAMQGRLDAGRNDVARGRELLRELGFAVAAAVTCVEAAMVELLADNPSGAKEDAVAARETLEHMGEHTFATGIVWALADVACFEGDYQGALELSNLTEAMSTAEDPHAQISWRRIKAPALAQVGGLEQAEHLARRAVDLAYETDSRIHRGDTSLALGMVLECAGMTDEAGSSYRRAEREFLLKGDLMSSAKARRLAARTATAE